MLLNASFSADFPANQERFISSLLDFQAISPEIAKFLESSPAISAWTQCVPYSSTPNDATLQQQLRV